MTDKEKPKKERLTAGKVQENLDSLRKTTASTHNVHAENTDIHRTRRQFLKGTAAVAVAAIGSWEVAKYFGRGISRWGQGFEPRFGVWILSPEEAAKLPESRQKELIAESNESSLHDDLNGFTQAGFYTYDNDNTLASIYRYSSLLVKNLHEWEDGPLMKRRTGREKFTYIVNGPGFNNETIEAKPVFLEDSEILELIVQADKLNSEGYAPLHEVFSKFESHQRGEEKVPGRCSVRKKDSGVTYHVRGLHILTPDKNPDLFAAYWQNRDKFKGGYEEFKAAYGNFEKAGNRIKALEDAAEGN
jgi:hypothetical protein